MTTSTDPHQSETSPAMLTALQSENSPAMITTRDHSNTPQLQAIPTNITIPSTTPSATQTVLAAPVQAPMPTSKTPKTSSYNINQQSSQHSPSHETHQKID